MRDGGRAQSAEGRARQASQSHPGEVPRDALGPSSVACDSGACGGDAVYPGSLSHTQHPRFVLRAGHVGPLPGACQNPTPRGKQVSRIDHVACSHDGEARGASLLSGGGGIALPATRSRRQTVLASGLCTGCVRPAAATASFPCRCRCRCLWTLGRVMSPGMLHRKLGFSPRATRKDFVWRYFEIPNTPISHQTLSVFIFKNLRGFKGSRSVQWVTIHPVPVSPRSRGPAWAGGGSCGVAPAAF